MARDPWRGLDELKNDLAAWDRGMVAGVAPEALQETATAVVDQAQRETPRRTGVSAASIEAGEVELSEKSAQIEVGSDWFVMVFIEWGGAHNAALRPIGRAIERESVEMQRRLLQAMDRHAQRHGL